MACLLRELHLDVPADAVWDALRDFPAVHTRVAPGFVCSCHMDGPNVRAVTFANGHTAHETRVGSDDAQRRLVYAVFSDRLHHYNAAVQVHVISAQRCRLTWHVDLLPDAMADYVRGQMDQAIKVMQTTLSRLA